MGKNLQYSRRMSQSDVGVFLHRSARRARSLATDRRSAAHASAMPGARRRSLFFLRGRLLLGRLAGYLRAGSARLREADRDRLFAALHLLARPAAFQRPAFSFMHRLLDL